MTCSLFLEHIPLGINHPTHDHNPHTMYRNCIGSKNINYITLIIIIVHIKSLSHVDIIIDITSLSQSIITLANGCIANFIRNFSSFAYTLSYTGGRGSRTYNTVGSHICEDSSLIHKYGTLNINHKNRLLFYKQNTKRTLQTQLVTQKRTFQTQLVKQ